MSNTTHSIYNGKNTIEIIEVFLKTALIVFGLFSVTIFVIPALFPSNFTAYLKQVNELSTLYQVLFAVILGFFTLFITYLLIKIPIIISQREEKNMLYERRYNLYQKLAQNLYNISIIKEILIKDTAQFNYIKSLKTNNSASKHEIQMAVVNLPLPHFAWQMIDILFCAIDYNDVFKNKINSLAENEQKKLQEIPNITMEFLTSLSSEEIKKNAQTFLEYELEKKRLHAMISIYVKKIIAEFITQKQFECIEIKLLYNLTASDEDLVEDVNKCLDQLNPDKLKIFLLDPIPNKGNTPEQVEEYTLKNNEAREEIVNKFLNLFIAYEKLSSLKSLMDKTLKINKMINL